MARAHINLRRKITRVDPIRVSEMLYLDVQEPLRWISQNEVIKNDIFGTSDQKKDHLKFNDLLEKNKFYDLHLMTGLKLSSDLVLLKAGRILRDTRQWNPMVFAFVYD